MKFVKTLAIATAVALSSASQALTVFETTDNDVNYLFQLTQAGMLSFTSDAISDLYVFNANNTDLGSLDAADGILLAPMSLTTVDFPSFFFALENNGQFVAATTIQEFGTANSYSLNFANGSAIIADVQEVPVPAAAWLFGSALVGMAGFARRKKA